MTAEAGELMELLTIKEVMAMFHINNRRTIDNWLYVGTLPRNLTVKIGRNLFFVKDKLEDFIKTTYENQQKLNA